MKTIISFTFLIFSFSLNAFQAPSCPEIEKDDPPFFVSDEYLQGDKIYENFRDLDSSQKASRYIPRGTIVYTPPELMENFDELNSRVPVEVLSMNESTVETSLGKSLYYDGKRKKRFAKQQFRAKVAGLRGKDKVKKGDVGYLDKRALRKAGKFTFTVKSDSPLYRSPNNTSLNDNYLRLAVNPATGKYKANRCCEPNPDPNFDGLLCVEHYQYEVVDIEGKLLDKFHINGNCNVLENVLPIPNPDALPIGKILKLVDDAEIAEGPLSSLGIENLELIPKQNKWRGSKVQTDQEIALMKFPIDNETREGPFNSFHYNPDEGTRNTANSDIFVEPMAGCAFMQVLKKFEKVCKGEPGCQVQFGDMYHPRNWMAHDSHGSGNCIDLRPQRANDDNQQNGLKYQWERYGQDKTEKLIKLLVQAGGEPIYFNDPVILKKYQDKDYLEELRPGVEKWDWQRKPKRMGGHDNHVHVCFPADSEDVKKACKDGL